MVFKEEIEPKWEDSRNNRGGRWICNVESRFKHRLNEMWLNLVRGDNRAFNYIFSILKVILML